MAAIVMVESNIHQRENMLPSEKAYTYKLLYDAMKHQGKSKKPTSSPVETKLRTDEELAYQLGESRIQIQRFMRLPKLLSVFSMVPITKPTCVIHPIEVWLK
ncbi:MAG: hypothetical protein IJI67_05930 [Clostridia bacterium]|nr:hypothetical protein [Clostridia bacterium]